jgi:hypothetical protein
MLFVFAPGATLDKVGNGISDSRAGVGRNFAIIMGQDSSQVVNIDGSVETGVSTVIYGNYQAGEYGPDSCNDKNVLSSS